MTMGRRQAELFIRELQAHPELIPDDRFVWTAHGRIECVLCGRLGVRGYVGPTPDLEYRPDGRVIYWNSWYPWAPWQIPCLGEHPWVCKCGLRFPAWANLSRHIARWRHPARVIRGHYMVSGLPSHVANEQAHKDIEPTGMRDLGRWPL